MLPACGFQQVYTALSLQDLPELLIHASAPVARYPGRVVVTLGVNPEAVIGDPVSLATTLLQGLKVAQDLLYVTRWLLP